MGYHLYPVIDTLFIIFIVYFLLSALTTIFDQTKQFYFSI